MKIQFKRDGNSHEINIDGDASMGEMLRLLSEHDSQTKVIYKGQKISTLDYSTTLGEYFGSKTSVSLMVLGSSNSAITFLEEKKAFHDQATINYRRALVTAPKHQVVFAGYARKIKVLCEFNDHDKARDLLQRLRDDNGIKQIMKEREWRIGSLIELHPHKDQTILGYNQNKGVVIALRLRTDDLTGFRSYNSIIKVLLHELAHMIWTEHDNNYNVLNRELNSDYSKYQGRKIDGSSGSSAITTARISAPPRILGGRALDEGLDKRDILANAALNRLSAEEEAMVGACGKIKNGSDKQTQRIEKLISDGADIHDIRKQVIAQILDGIFITLH